MVTPGRTWAMRSGTVIPGRTMTAYRVSTAAGALSTRNAGPLSSCTHMPSRKPTFPSCGPDCRTASIIARPAGYPDGERDRDDRLVVDPDAGLPDRRDECRCGYPVGEQVGAAAGAADQHRADGEENQADHDEDAAHDDQLAGDAAERDADV